jgi:hypothetical protein
MDTKVGRLNPLEPHASHRLIAGASKRAFSTHRIKLYRSHFPRTAGQILGIQLEAHRGFYNDIQTRVLPCAPRNSELTAELEGVRFRAKWYAFASRSRLRIVEAVDNGQIAAHSTPEHA